ncbi:Lysophosphatidylcholine acyltransferase 1 (LPC acyltransferase 1) (LPCAT-1) (LysoPC acyltransferase 1) (1-acylglycerol-3-phosphate O-acyltransferase) (1-acylglycerophosphocholine O-acyltransferase) (1-alkenylglycerophosphocholine O-acyltransferase) (1-alkylglycerophosphocholine O-acetyltransferase) (Acetyl-CoA:lyso-platelet-activating factor acetyltransferase) (Acetyl-CoA:lyso-PAF acetyltransferase) (Lyso-PAF acetyltransferase) (LysoPAFAT) (Acyltransferase-like 2) (Phosphonoformate immuno-associated protein 3), partial [Durusdinium trenchii]
DQIFAGFPDLPLCLKTGADPQVFHKERLDWIGRPGKHPVLVPNHISMLEAFYLEYLTWGMSGCVAKSQFAIPGVRSATQFSNAVAVDTKDKDVKQKVNEGILKFVHNEPDEKGRYPCGRAFVIYPEGITNSQRGLFRFNTGAFATGMAVQPVVQRFPYKYMNPAWVSDSRISRGNDLPWMMLRVRRRRRLRRQVKICEIWEPIEAERNDAVLYASNVPLVFLCAKGVVGRCVCVCNSARVGNRKRPLFSCWTSRIRSYRGFIEGYRPNLRAL